MTEEKNIPGCKVSIAWDKIEGEDFIMIRDQDGETIVKAAKYMWEGMTAKDRDAIMERARNLYG